MPCCGGGSGIVGVWEGVQEYRAGYMVSWSEESDHTDGYADGDSFRTFHTGDSWLYMLLE